MSKADQDVRRAYQYAERHVLSLSILATVLIPSLYPVDRLLFEPTYDTLALRIFGGLVGGFVGLSCTFSDKELLRRFAPYIWLVGVSSIFHVMLSAMLTLNAATTPVGGEVHVGWTTSYLVGLFCFVLVINILVVSLLSWLVGSVIAVLLVFTIPDPNWGVVFDSFIVPTGIWLSAIVVGSFANRSLRVVESAKTETARAVASNIAHELRTPLAGIVARARGARGLIPELWEGYESVPHQASRINQPLSRREVEEVGDRLQSIAEEAQFANIVIDLLLNETVSRRGWTLEPESISAEDALGEVLHEYPWATPERRDKVSVASVSDFSFRASRLLFKYALTKLIEAGLEEGSTVQARVSAGESREHAGSVSLIIDPNGDAGEDDVLGNGQRGVGDKPDEVNLSNRTLREICGELLIKRQSGKLSSIELRIGRAPGEQQAF